MKRTSGELLEFEELKRLVGRYVAGPLGRAELDRLQPVSDREYLESTLAEVAEAVDFVRTNGRLPLGGLVDSNESVARLRIKAQHWKRTRSLISSDSWTVPMRCAGCYWRAISLTRDEGIGQDGRFPRTSA